MAFSRSYLKSLGLNDDQTQAIVDAHLEVVNSIKEERDKLKDEAAKAVELQKQIDDLKSGEDYKAKYEEEHKAYEAYKGEVAKREEHAKIEAEYRKLLTEEKIPSKRLDAVVRLTEFGGMKLDKEGHLQDADKLREDIRKDWSDYITETHERGADVQTPPTTGKPSRSKAEILAIKDAGERQKAIAENHELFGF